MYKLDINAVETEGQQIIAFYKKQLDTFYSMKKEIEKVQWSDSNYDRLVESMNTIGHEICKIIQTLTNGNDVYVISDLLPLAREYTQNASKFPKL